MEFDLCLLSGALHRGVDKLYAVFCAFHLFSRALVSGQKIHCNAHACSPGNAISVLYFFRRNLLPFRIRYLERLKVVTLQESKAASETAARNND